jgi:hypothetical protein
LGGDFRRAWRDRDGSELILAEISIAGLWIDRSKKKSSFIDLRKDFTVTLSQVIVFRKKVETLIDNLVKWLDSPAEILQDLCGDTKDQSLEFYLGPPDSRERLEKTIFEVRYSGTAFKSAKWSFGTDQSCIRILVDELHLALEELGHST